PGRTACWSRRARTRSRGTPPRSSRSSTTSGAACRSRPARCGPPPRTRPRSWRGAGGSSWAPLRREAVKPASRGRDRAETGQGSVGSMHGYSADKQAYLVRLRRIEGQVRGLQRMVEQDAYCIDILTQVSAVTRALQSVALGLLEDHIGHCVAEAISK